MNFNYDGDASVMHTHCSGRKLLIIFAVAITALSGCGGGGSGDDAVSSATNNDYARGFYAPEYSKSGVNSVYGADLNGITLRVLEYQSVDQQIANLIVWSDGVVQVLGNLKVQLVSMSRNDCPSNLDGCDTTDSSLLGVASNALIRDISSLSSAIRNQGERGTCVAFAMAAAMEVLANRTEQSVDLSEQNSYFQGKKLTDTWTSSGLSAYDTTAAFVNQSARFVSESYWPYNVQQKQCSAYWQQYPTATCSETEAQGGGSDFHQQDQNAAAAAGYAITTAHELYASVGRVKQALYRGFPVILAINANYDFLFATNKGGVVSWAIKADDCGTSLCGHAVLAVGYQDDDRVAGGGYLVVKNSWGTDWGDNGMAYLTYEWLQHSLLDAQALVRYSKVSN